MVFDPKIDPRESDEFWQAEFRGFQKIETSNPVYAEKILDEYRKRILLFIVLTFDQRTEYEKLLEKAEGIPYVLFVRAKETKDQIERMMNGEKVCEPFDSVLEAWLHRNIQRDITGQP